MPRSPAAARINKLVRDGELSTVVSLSDVVVIVSVVVGLLAIGVIVHWCEGFARVTEPKSYAGATLVWDIARVSTLKKCDTATVDIDPSSDGKMRINKDRPDCVNVSMIFRMPIDWEILDDAPPKTPFMSIPELHAKFAIPHSSVEHSREHFWVPSMGVGYWARWNRTNFQIVLDNATEPLAK